MVATAFVGRAEVLGELGRALAGAAAGTGCVALVYGEAGIGKTRLCRQVQDAHRGRGGQVLVGRGSPEEKDAVTLLAGIGADRQAWRAEETLRRLGGQPAQPRVPAGPLSAREMEVARLVAEGLSNPAIARRLYLSRPTVASHVAHILTKLGFASRAQIAAWVARQSRTGPA